MSEDQFWEDLGVNSKYLIEKWESHYKATLENFLKKLDETNLIDICEKLGVLGKAGPNAKKSELVAVLLSSKYAHLLIRLLEFYREKIEIINEHFARLVVENKIIHKNRGNAFIKLIDIYLCDKDELKTLCIHAYWNRNVTFSHKFKPSIPLKQEFIDELDTRTTKFLKELKGEDWRDLKFKYFGKTIAEQRTTYSFFRQTADKLIRNIDKNKRNKVASDLLLRFDLAKQVLEIRCRDPRVVSKTLKILLKVLRIRFAEDIRNASGFDEVKLAKALESKDSSSNLQISGILFNQSNLNGGAALEIPATYQKASIENSISDLKERKIVELKTANIDKIVVRYHDKLREIVLNKDGLYRYYSLQKKSRLSDSELSLLSEEFKKITGVFLDERVLVTDHELNRDELVQDLLNMDSIEPKDKIIREILKELQENHILSCTETKKYQCYHCRRSNNKGSPCPFCDSTETNQTEEYTEIRKNRNGIVDFIITKINDPSILLRDKSVFRTWSRKYEFAKLEYELCPVYVFVSFGNISSSLISFFQRSALPIIIIQAGNKLDKDLLDLTNFKQVELSKLVSGKLSAAEFSELIKETVKSTHSQIVSAAKTSANKLKNIPEDYTHNDFENDTFNIFRFVLQNVDRWGKEKLGKELPEGLLYLNFQNKLGINKKTGAWDCKFTYKEKRELDINSKRQIVTYVRKLNKKDEIRQSSGKLNAFLIVSNSLTESEFEPFAKYVIDETGKWKGNVVLLEKSELLQLYKLYDENFKEISENINNFRKELCQLLFAKKPNQRFKITTEHITAIMTHLRNEPIDTEETNPQ